MLMEKGEHMINRKQGNILLMVIFSCVIIMYAVFWNLDDIRTHQKENSPDSTEFISFVVDDGTSTLLNLQPELLTIRTDSGDIVINMATGLVTIDPSNEC